MTIKSYEEGDLEIDCADFGEHPDCTGNVARSNELYVRQKERLGSNAQPFFFHLIDYFR